VSGDNRARRSGDSVGSVSVAFTDAGRWAQMRQQGQGEFNGELLLRVKAVVESPNQNAPIRLFQRYLAAQAAMKLICIGNC
jgi:hypothetical protein